MVLAYIFDANLNAIIMCQLIKNYHLINWVSANNLVIAYLLVFHDLWWLQLSCNQMGGMS